MRPVDCTKCKNSAILWIKDDKKGFIPSGYILCSKKHLKHHQRVLRDWQFCSKHEEGDIDANYTR